jgi:hypothetical protein
VLSCVDDVLNAKFQFSWDDDEVTSGYSLGVIVTCDFALTSACHWTVGLL